MLNRKYFPSFVVSFTKKMVYGVFLATEKLFSGPFDRYDFETFLIFKRVLKENSNCIDIGAHKGFILQKIIKNAPKGKHFAVEPIPALFKKLEKKYRGKLKLFNLALSDHAGSASFTIFKDRPAVSGLRERKFENVHYETEKINVELNTLDNIIPENLPVNLIKIDVEGAELFVLKGGEKLIRRCKPYILFEFGIGGSDIYGTTPEEMFDFLDACGLCVSTQNYFLKGRSPFSKEEFCGQYYKSYNFFFIAYPFNPQN